MIQKIVITIVMDIRRINMRVYRIYDKYTQKFKDEGAGYCNPPSGFSKYGKIWKSLRNVKLHIQQAVCMKPERYELVEYELMERGRMPLEEFVKEMNQK